MDKGPEFVSKGLVDWAQRHGITLQFIQPGKRTQNASIERFNRTYRTVVLDCYVSESPNEVRCMTDEWMRRYNHERPHESLNRLPPVPFTTAPSPHHLL
jgi:putative transposase